MTKAGCFASGGSDDALLWHPSYAGLRTDGGRSLIEIASLG
jgi:hypothetical protein